MNINKILLFITLLLLFGCFPKIKPLPPPKPIAAFDLDKLRKIPFLRLCKDHNIMTKNGQLTPRSGKELEGILKEKGLTTKDLKKAKERKINVGMSQCGMYVSWGTPQKENRTVSKHSIRIQHIYGYSFDKRTYIYTDNGKITSWQD